LAAGQAAKLPLALGATTREMMNLARAGDYGQSDFSGLLDYLCEAAGIEKPRLKTAKSKAAE
jgi:4-hydroxybutyrate dehydrogenase/sulfolactaldehyde 3-reductase